MGDNSQEIDGSSFIEFTAQTRMSGVDLPMGLKSEKAPLRLSSSMSRSWAERFRRIFTIR